MFWPFRRADMPQCLAMHTFWQDLRFALRMLRKNLGFTVVAVATLALGIGANAAIFSIVDAVLLKPLPYANSERLVSLTARSFPRFTHLQQQSRSLDVAAYYATSVSFVTAQEPEAVPAAHVSLGFFQVLRVTPILGRSFLPIEQEQGGPNVAILSDGFWHSHFAANPSIIGSAIVLDGIDTTVVGVLPSGFRFPFISPEPDIWLPRIFEHPLLKPAQVQLGAGYLDVFGRLRVGQTLEHAQAEMATLDDAYQHQFAGLADANREDAVKVSGLAETLVGGLRKSLLVLMVAVGFVLLIACANVANLLLARATAREKEIALRKALGASRNRLFAQLLTESFVLSLLGAVLGIALALAAMPILRSLKIDVPRLSSATLDAPVLAFAFLLCLATTIFFGIAPAAQATRKQLQDALKEGLRGSSTGGRGKLRQLLVTAEMATALILITGAGLLGDSFAHLLRVNLGFSPQGLVTFPLSLPSTRYAKHELQTAFYRQVLQRVQTVPGVESAAFVSFLPLTGAYRQSYFCPEGQVCQGIGKDPLIAFWQVSTGYFETMRTPLLRGRFFNEHDVAGGAPVIILNETAARHFWPNENALGKHIKGSRDPAAREVVGVVADTKFTTLSSAGADQFYVPSEQMPYPSMTLVVKISGKAKPVTDAVRAKIAEVDPTLPVSGIQSMDQVIAASVSQPRLITQFITVFAAFAVLLAAIGMYGVMAYSVGQQRREMGIRVSLGAEPRDIVRLVLGQGMKLAIAGVLVGAVASLAFTRLLASLLFGVAATDPFIFTAAVLTMTSVALLACYLPARRATRVDPISVLRAE
jgi:putative ABC transport system permease protein